jgi:uncharacterized protein (UPF0332 family)
MDPRKFCELAGHLAVRSDAAAHRSAISRAYYSLFHVILQYMQKAGIPLPERRADCHEKLYWLLFNGTDDPTLKGVARELHDLRVKRNTADYDLGVDYVEKQKNAMAYVELAKRATDRFDQCCQDSIRITQAMDDVKRYATNVLKLK